MEEFYRTLTDEQLQAQIDALRSALAGELPDRAPYQQALGRALVEQQRRMC